MQNEAQSAFELGKKLLDDRNPSEAVCALAKAVRLAADVAEYHAWYAQALNGDNQPEVAIHEAQRAVQLDPQCGKGFSQMGNAYNALRDYSKATEAFSQAITINGQDSWVYCMRSLSYLRLKDYEHAILDASCAIKLAPTEHYAYVCRGDSYRLLGNHERAISDYSKAIAIVPTDADTFAFRGLSYAALKNHEMAVRDFSKAIELAPQTRDYYEWRLSSYHAISGWQQYLVDAARYYDLGGEIPSYATDGVEYPTSLYIDSSNQHFHGAVLPQLKAGGEKIIKYCPLSLLVWGRGSKQVLVNGASVQQELGTAGTGYICLTDLYLHVVSIGQVAQVVANQSAIGPLSILRHVSLGGNRISLCNIDQHWAVPIQTIMTAEIVTDSLVNMPSVRVATAAQSWDIYTIYPTDRDILSAALNMVRTGRFADIWQLAPSHSLAWQRAMQERLEGLGRLREAGLFSDAEVEASMSYPEDPDHLLRDIGDYASDKPFPRDIETGRQLLAMLKNDDFLARHLEVKLHDNESWSYVAELGQWLGDIGGEEITDALLNVLLAPEIGPCTLGATNVALGVIGPPVVARLLKVYETSSPRIKNVIIRIFSRVGLKVTSPARMSGHWPRRLIRDEGGDKRTIPYLVEALHSPDDSVVEDAAFGLYRLADPSTAEALLYVTQGKGAPRKVRKWAVLALGRMKAPCALEKLLEFGYTYVGDETEREVYSMLAGYGEMAVAPLLRMFAGPTTAVEFDFACRALASIDAARFAGLFIQELLNPERQSRVGSLIGHLALALPDEYSLQAIPSEDLVKLAPHPDNTTRTIIFGIMAYYRNPRFVRLFLAGLQDPWIGVRLTSQEGLTRLGADARDALVALLDDPVSDIQNAAMARLVMLGETASVERIQRARKQAKAVARAARVKASLGVFADSETTASLCLKLRDTDGDIRLSALEALVTIGGDVPSEPVRNLLADPEVDIRRAAIRALGLFGDEKALRDLQALWRAEYERPNMDRELTRDYLAPAIISISKRIEAEQKGKTSKR